jgi:hypothetical protein
MRTRLAFAFLVVAAAGCDTSGIHALGRLRDPLVPCVADPSGLAVTTSTWLRSTPDATELLLLGRRVATEVVMPDHPACFAHAVFAHDGSTTIAFGSYALDAAGMGQATHVLDYTLAYQPERSILERDGAVRTDLPTPIDDPLTIALDHDHLEVTLADASMRLTAISDVVGAIDLTKPGGADDLFRLYDLPQLTSQTRLLGFGSGAMTQYVGTDAKFGGMIRDDFTVNVESLLSPNTTIAYHQLEDLTGIVVDGDQRTNVDTHGNGAMDGSLGFLMHGPGDRVIRGHVSYAGLKIGNGLASGGSYALSIDGDPTSYSVSYQVGTQLDLRTVLPVDAP